MVVEPEVSLHKQEEQENKVNANQHQGETRLKKIQRQGNIDSNRGTLSAIHATVMDIFPISTHHIPGLGKIFCNRSGTLFVCSPYHLFLGNLKLIIIYIYIYIIVSYLNCIIYTIIVFPFGRKSADYCFSYLNRIIFTIIIFLFGRK